MKEKEDTEVQLPPKPTIKWSMESAERLLGYWWAEQLRRRVCCWNSHSNRHYPRKVEAALGCEIAMVYICMVRLPVGPFAGAVCYRPEKRAPSLI